MLVLSRRQGESITIGDDIVVTVVSIKRGQAQVGITAPNSVRILREEIFEAMRKENRAAARGLQGLKGIEEILARLPHKQ